MAIKLEMMGFMAIFLSLKCQRWDSIFIRHDGVKENFSQYFSMAIFASGAGKDSDSSGL